MGGGPGIAIGVGVGEIGCTIASAVLEPQIALALENVGDRFLLITVGFGVATPLTVNTNYVKPVPC